MCLTHVSVNLEFADSFPRAQTSCISHKHSIAQHVAQRVFIYMFQVCSAGRCCTYELRRSTQAELTCTDMYQRQL